MRNEPYPPRPLTDVEIAWVAGLYEGEGTVVLGTSTYKRKDNGETKRLGARASVSMTDRDVIERLEALFPCTNGVYTRLKLEKPEYKTQYVWRIGKRDHIAAFLRAILPHLGERRAEQALKVLAYVESPSGGYGSGHRNKTHCPKGHPYDDANTYLKPDARRPGEFCRTCRACRNASYRQQYARRKAKRLALKQDAC